MAKQLNVNLAFQADTSQALRNIQDLQKALNSLSTIKPMEGLTLTKDMQVAVNSAKELERHLGNAFNANTGNFDLSRLNTSLKASNTDLATLTNGLLKAGIQGEQAFMKVQRALSTSAVQIKQANGALTQFWTTLKNTARWQLSSSLIHGFMGALQQAYGYAQDLDKSLNNIRIVTGASNAEMAKFAESANKAAKELRTTTTAYTNASLIYYQQGLSAEEVKQRTDVTVKMANAAGVSAEKVSDQLTAVWNNFAKGGKNLEYYADVMTALGASTASSTDEIATGLEKFAAVAETVGLSYEYATAALATVTAETRQSADVVGTAFKTLFARLQGLQLGETLDDGTTLNKYSQALAKVGIDIMDASGEMKKMDTILDEMAGKWNTLSNAQQVALAQTVGGVRQYNQLISLMDNWDVMQTNLTTAKNSSGALQEQADIYAESWEAANKKVKASLEGLYTDLIPTETIIDITNGFAVVIEGVDEFIQGMGGLKSILLMISTIALNRMAPSLGASLQTGIDKVKSLDISFTRLKQSFQSGSTIVGNLHKELSAISGEKMSSAAQQTKYFSDNLEKSASTATKLSQTTITQALNQGILSDEFKAYMNDMSKVNNLQAIIEQAGNRLTQEQKEQLATMQQQVIAASERHQQEVQNLSILQQQAEAMAETHDMSVYQGDNFSLAKDEQGNDTGDLTYDSGITATENMKKNVGLMLKLWEANNSEFNKGSVTLQKMGDHVGFLVKNEKAFLQLNRNSLDSYRKTVTLNQRIKAIADDTTTSAETRRKKILALVEAAKKECNFSRQTVKAYEDGAKQLKDTEGMTEGLSKAMQTTTENARNFAAAAGNGSERLKQAQGLGEGIAQGILNSERAANQTKVAIENVVSALHRGISASMNLGTSIVKIASGLSTVAMGANALNNMFTTLGDSSATGLEKFSAVATSSVMAIQGLMVVIKGLNTLMDMHNAKMQMSTMMKQLNTAADAKSQAQMLLGMVLKKKDLSTDEQAILMEQLEQSIKEKGIGVTLSETAANYGLAASELAALWPLGLIVAILAVLAATIIGVIALVDAFTVSNEEMAERTAEASKNLGESAKAAKEEAQGIKDAFTEYDEVVDALNSCTKGTDEWREALEKVKGKVSEILDQYPDLLKYEGLLQWNDEAGAYMFNTDSSKGTTMDDVIAQADKRADTLAYASQMASGKASAAKANVSQDTYNNKTNGYVWDTDISQMTDNIERNKEIIREEARKYIEAHPESYTQDADYYLGLWEQSINSAAQAGADYATKVEEAGNIMLAASQMAASEILSNEDGTSDYDQASANAGAAVIQKEYDRIYDEIYGTNGANGLIGSQYAQADNRNDVGKHGANDVLTRYEAAVGKDIDWAANAVQGNDQNRTFVYLENGEEKQLSPEQIAATIAAYESTQNKGLVEDAANTVQNIIGELTGNEDGLGAVTAISNGGEKSDMANVFANMTEGELADINKMFEDGATQEEIAQAFGMTTDQLNTMLETFGIDFQTFADNCTAAATEVAGSLTEAQQEVLTNAGVGDTSGMTMEEKIAYSNNISSAKSNLTDNELGENLINDIIGDVENADVDPEQMSKFIGAIGTLDLTAEDAAEQVAALAEEYGIEGVAIDNLITGVEGLDQVYNIATKSVMDQAASLKEVVGEGLETGDVISAEDIKVLEDAGINVDQYFTQMADGTYSLTGKADEFNAAVNRITFEGLKQQWEDFSRAEAQVLENYNSGAYNGKIRDTSSVQAGDASANKGYSYTEYGAGQLGKARLDYINSFDAGTFNFTEEQNKLLADYTANPEMELTVEQLQTIAEMIDTVNTKSVEMEAQMFSTATSLSELSQMASEMGSYSLNAYSEGLINLASQYENCSDEITDLQEAMLSGDEVMIQSKIDALELATAIGELSKKYGLDAEDVETHAKLIQKNAKGMKLSAEQAANLAVANRRMNKGVATLNENWKDWSKILKSSDRTTADYADTLNDAHEALADLVGAVDAGSIPLDFLDASTESGAEHLEWMARAAEGDAQAINLLGTALAIAQVKAMEVAPAMQQAYADAFDIDPSEVESRFLAAQTAVSNAMQQIHDAIAAGLSTEEINAKINAMGTDWVDGLNEMALATGMSVEQMNAMLNQMGVQAEVEVKDVPQKMKIQGYAEQVHQTGWYDQQYFDYTTNETKSRRMPLYSKYTVPGPTKEIDGVVQVAQIKTEGGSIESPTVTYTGTSGGSVGGGISPSSTSGGSSGGGGGDKAPAPAKKEKVQKRSEFGERYHTVTKQLENTSRELERASRAADKLWSRKRLKYLEEQNALLDEEIALLREQNRQAQDYLELDQSDLDSTALDLGYTINYGENGEILNYDTIVDGYAQAMIAAQNHLNTLATKDEQDAYKEAFIDPLQEKIDAFDTAVDLYYETLNIIQDNNDLIQEKMDQQMENNFEKWSGELELDIAINERDLEILEYYLSKVEDDVYKMAEAVAIMVGSLGDLEGGGGGQLSEYLGNLDIYNTKLEELNIKLAAGEITEAAYEEGLEEIRAGLLENLEALNELDKAMLEYYSDTLSLVMEEMDKYTEKMEHQTSILEHYANMMEILGKSQDYEALGTILEGQVKTIENELAVAEAEFEMYAAEAETKRQLYEDAVASGNVEAAEVYKREWEAAESAAMEAQSEMLEKTEAWAEAMRAVVENQLSSLAKTLEQSLTGGTSFDYINTQLERAASLQEEYLTTTNQIYETNKLMRTAQQEIDKTTNTVAKQRLKNFIKETDQLQNKSKLSKYELEIQQAKYDLLLAEIALEEAQQAKSTVRLQRDSEGNFGYVYTADQNQLEQAQQQLEDAQNSLYNIGLEGANSYAEKYSQTMQEMYDTLTSISEAYFNGEIASQEEYEQQILAAQEYYYQQLENYQELYGIAVEVDTRIIKDAWSSNFTSMIHSTEEWKNKVDDYARDAAQSLHNWYTQVENIAKKTGLDNIAQKVQTVTDKSDELKDTILGTNGEKGVITALQDELTAVSNLTGGYANLRSTLQGVITTYEELMAIVTAAQNNETSTGSSDTNNDDNNSDDNNNDDGSGGSGSGDGGGDSGSGDTKSYQTGTISFSGDGSSRIWKDSSGKTYAYGSAEQKKMQQAFNKAYNSNGGYKGDYWIGWTNDGGKLNADVLHKKYGLSTGGYTGDWPGSYGKLAFLHQKELVLNAQDTENLLASMDILDKIISTIDLYSNSAQLGGLLHTPTYNGFGHNESLEQNVRIEASFPGVTDRNEIEEAFNNLVNRASQYANRK